MSKKSALSPGLKLALDMGPLVLFFFANSRWGIFAGTGVFMVAVAIATAISYTLTRHLPVMTIVSGIVVLVFGGATLLFQNETFIKVKPTIIYLLFAGILAGGLLWGKSLLAVVFNSVFDLDATGWRKLTVRWAIFFGVLAVLNEIVWRTQTTDFWVSFKVFAILPLTFAFAALQYPLLARHANKTAEPGE